MGGSRSGRWCGRPTAEATASYVLTAKSLRGLRTDFRGEGQGTLPFGDEFVLHFRLIGDGYDPYFEFQHESRRDGDDEVSYTVGLRKTPCRFGGWRWWWRCPASGLAVFKLFLPYGGWQFRSRSAYRLGYACQRETLRDRRVRKALKLHRALGGDGSVIGDDTPPKPKGMHWTTYEMRVREWEHAEQEADQMTLASAARLLARPR